MPRLPLAALPGAATALILTAAVASGAPERQPGSLPSRAQLDENLCLTPLVHGLNCPDLVMNRPFGLYASRGLYLTGRKKLLIEIGGYKVDPVEVQDVVLAHPKVRDAVVVGAEGKVEGEEIVKAVVVPVEDCDDREVLDFCRERLANFKVPQMVEFREEIPKSPLGKVLRKYLV